MIDFRFYIFNYLSIISNFYIILHSRVVPGAILFYITNNFLRNAKFTTNLRDNLQTKQEHSQLLINVVRTRNTGKTEIIDDIFCHRWDKCDVICDIYRTTFDILKLKAVENVPLCLK